MLASGSDNEVWSYGEEAYPILVKYMKRREALREYIRDLMQSAHETGIPVIRAMFYAFPQDQICNDLKDQYMFGPKYLVAPVFENNARSRSVYFPAGVWRNVDTQEVVNGKQHAEVPSPLEVIPVFEKIG